MGPDLGLDPPGLNLPGVEKDKNLLHQTQPTVPAVRGKIISLCILAKAVLLTCYTELREVYSFTQTRVSACFIRALRIENASTPLVAQAVFEIFLPTRSWINTFGRTLRITSSQKIKAAPEQKPRGSRSAVKRSEGPEERRLKDAWEEVKKSAVVHLKSQKGDEKCC